LSSASYFSAKSASFAAAAVPVNVVAYIFANLFEFVPKFIELSVIGAESLSVFKNL